MGKGPQPVCLIVWNLYCHGRTSDAAGMLYAVEGSGSPGNIVAFYRLVAGC
jgi:hypothetical protein